MHPSEVTKFIAFFVPLFLSFLVARAESIPIHGAPGPIAAGHLNEDDHADLVVGDQERDVIIVLFGDGDGQFTEATGSPYALGSPPEDLVIADIDGDGLSDLAIANHEVSKLMVLIGKGGGQFTESPHSPIEVDSRPHPHGIAVGDFNMDGTMDLATESWEDDEVIVVYGEDGAYASKPHARLKVGDFPYYKLRSSDLNGDKRSDLVTTNWGSSNLSVLLANRSGGFDSTIFIPTPLSPFAVAIGDLNRDGHQDLAVAHRVGNSSDNSADGLSVFLGDGTGGFDRYPGSVPSVGRSPTGVAVGDYNGDGWEDIAVANYGSDDVTVILADEDGFKAAEGSPFQVGDAPVTVLLEDLNGDGKGDLVTSNSEGRSLSIVISVQ